MNRNHRSTRIALGLAAALMAVTPLAQAGGLAPLQVGIEGLTKDNRAQCEKLLRTAFADQLVGGGKNHYDVTFAHLDTTPVARLQIDQKPLSLAALEKALKDSPFSIKRNSLQFQGVVRLHVSGTRDRKALSEALRKEGDASVHVIAGDNDLTTVLVSGTSDAPLFTYQRLTAVLEGQGAKLDAVTWGRAKDAREPDLWHCRKPFGARHASPATAARSR